MSIYMMKTNGKTKHSPQMHENVCHADLKSAFLYYTFHHSYIPWVPLAETNVNGLKFYFIIQLFHS